MSSLRHNQLPDSNYNTAARSELDKYGIFRVGSDVAAVQFRQGRATEFRYMTAVQCTGGGTGVALEDLSPHGGGATARLRYTDLDTRDVASGIVYHYTPEMGRTYTAYYRLGGNEELLRAYRTSAALHATAQGTTHAAAGVAAAVRQDPRSPYTLRQVEALRDACTAYLEAHPEGHKYL